MNSVVQKLESDGGLIVRTAQGDCEAFEELHRRFARPMFGFALRRLANRDRAEDATQETFAAIWRSARTYRPERGPGAPWLYTVARNAIVNQVRLGVESIAEVPDAPADDPGPAQDVESAWLSAHVYRAVETLPEHERAVIELAYWGGLSQSEVASSMNIPIGTVKTRTRKALARLAVVLEHDDLLV